LPSAKKATERLSGNQNGKLAPSVPASSCRRGWRKWTKPEPWLAVSASCEDDLLPVGEKERMKSDPLSRA
jgi:hypothetical protein